MAEDKESEVERLKREKESIVSLLIYLRSRIPTGTYTNQRFMQQPISANGVKLI